VLHVQQPFVAPHPAPEEVRVCGDINLAPNLGMNRRHHQNQKLQFAAGEHERFLKYHAKETIQKIARVGFELGGGINVSLCIPREEPIGTYLLSPPVLQPILELKDGLKHWYLDSADLGCSSGCCQAEGLSCFVAA
jgi:hypothetical protein